MDYGFGIVAFFKLMRRLIYVYGIISILACFMMWLYTFGNAIEGGRNGSVSQFSLGNYGFTMNKCFIQYFKLRESSQLVCPQGKTMSALLYSGIVPDVTPLHTT